MFYAQTPTRRARQMASDLTAVGWVVLWVIIALWVRGRLLRLAAPGRSLESAGTGFAGSLDQAGDHVGDVPIAGGALSAPFRAAADAGRTLAQAGAAQQSAVAHLALWFPLLLAALPILCVLARWLSVRARWIVEVNAAARLTTDDAGVDLLALRALTRQPITVLRRLGPDPAAAWRGGDPRMLDALAQLELEELGIRYHGPR